MKIKSILGASCTCMLAMSAHSINAAVIEYEEAVDGDISQLGTSPVFNFDVGINTISGSTHFIVNDFDSDSFSIYLPNNLFVTEVTYTFDNVSTLPGTTGLGTSYAIHDSSGALGIGNSIQILDDTSPITNFVIGLPLGEDTFRFTQLLGRGGDGGSWDYTLSFEVVSTAVPIPPAFWLFGSGLLGLVGMTRRKKA